MAKDKIRVAIIGNGIIGEAHLSTYRNIPEAEVAAICDINEERLNDVGDRFGIKRRFTHIGKL
ncbi:MAG: Gfo/Idh/MocA family oxidoreductase, partial [Clostridia bacterium]|nr:Gfo/Idh/MocA family oxidoreductase [Clostridia bacterium]